jgi:hypothetical protein
MKLSEAIRLGAMLQPQGFGVLKDDRGRTCALGAALSACNLMSDRDPYGREIPQTTWPELCQGHVLCQVCERRMLDTFDLVTHLNDDHRWTRAAIAEWVATLEPAEAQIEEHPAAVTV